MSSKLQRIGFVAFVLACLIAAPASQAGITVTAPNVNVDYQAASAGFTIIDHPEQEVYVCRRAERCEATGAVYPARATESA